MSGLAKSGSPDRGRLPHPEAITVARGKIIGYFYDSANARGWPKGQFFLRFGFSLGNPLELERALLEHGRVNPVVRETLVAAEHGGGVKWNVRGPLRTPDGRNPVITTVWKRDEGENAPHLVTATFKRDRR